MPPFGPRATPQSVSKVTRSADWVGSRLTCWGLVKGTRTVLVDYLAARWQARWRNKMRIKRSIESGVPMQRYVSRGLELRQQFTAKPHTSNRS